MNASDILFFLASAVAVGAAVLASVEKRLLNSALAFGTFLLAVACLFLLIGDEFVAVAQVFVYVGGVAVLILLAVMLTASRGGQRSVDTGHRVVAMIAALALAGVIIVAAASMGAGVGAAPASMSVAALGESLLGSQLFGFELVGLILLAAVVAALAIVRREAE